MIATKEAPHIHNFTKLGYVREVGTSPGGEFVDRIILIRDCDGEIKGKPCPASQAFECGPKEPMRKLYAKLIGG